MNYLLSVFSPVLAALPAMPQLQTAESIGSSELAAQNLAAILLVFVIFFGGLSAIMIFIFRVELRRYRSLKNRNDQLEAVFKALPFPCTVEDPEDAFRIVFASDGIAKFINVPMDDVQGQKIEDLLTSPAEAGYLHAIAIGDKNSSGGGENCKITSNDGENCLIRIARSDVELPSGKHLVCLAGFDVTAMEDRIRTAETELSLCRRELSASEYSIIRIDMDTFAMPTSGILTSFWPVNATGHAEHPEKVVAKSDLEGFMREWDNLRIGKIPVMDYAFKSDYRGFEGRYRLILTAEATEAGHTEATGTIHRISEDEYTASANLSSILIPFLNSLSSAVFVKELDDNLKYRYVNKAFLDVVGRELEDVIGKNDISFLPSDVFKIVRAADASVAKAPLGTTETSSYHFRGRSGLRYHRVTRTMFNHDGHKYIVGIVLDVSDYVRSTEALGQTADIFINGTGDDHTRGGQLDLEYSNKSVTGLLGKLRDMMGASHGFVRSIDFDKDSVSTIAVVGVNGTNVKVPFKYSAARAVIDKALTEGYSLYPSVKDFIREISDDDNFWSNNLDMPHPKSIIIIPIPGREQPIGWISLGYDSEKASISTDEIRFMRMMAIKFSIIMVASELRSRFSDMESQFSSFVSQVNTASSIAHVSFITIPPSIGHDHVMIPFDSNQSVVPIDADGNVLALEKWVSPVDLPELRGRMQRLFDHVLPSIDVMFQGRVNEAEAGDKAATYDHQFRFVMSESKELDGSYRGAIIDITQQLSNIGVKADHITSLWMNFINALPVNLIIREFSEAGTIVAISKQMAKTTAHLGVNLIGKADKDVFSLETTQRLRQIRRNASADADGAFGAMDFAMSNSSIRHHKVCEKLFTGYDGHKYLACAAMDIDNERNEALRESLISALATDVLSSDSPEGMIPKMLEQVRSHLGLDRMIYLVPDSNGAISIEAESDATGILSVADIGIPVLDCLWNNHKDLLAMSDELRWETISSMADVGEQISQNHRKGRIDLHVLRDGGKVSGLLVANALLNAKYNPNVCKVLADAAHLVHIIKKRIHESGRIDYVINNVRAMIDGLPIPVLIFNRDGSLNQINKKAGEFFGASDFGAAPFACSEILKCGVSRVNCPVRRALADGKPHSLELKYKGTSIKVVTTPIFDKENNLVNVVETVTVLENAPILAIEPEKVPQESPKAEEPPPKKLKALLVDDIPINLTVLSSMLRKFNMDITTRSSGAEALSLEDRFDIVFTDIWMPEMNGVELAGLLRKKSPRTVLVAITADIECRNNFDMSVFDSIMHKPVSISSLSEVLAKYFK